MKAAGDDGRGQPGPAEAGLASPDHFVSDVFAWLDAVLADHDLPALAFPVAYAIVQHANARTRLAWPSQPRIAEMVGRNEKNVRPAIRALIERGHLTVAKNRGGGGTTQYRLPDVNRAKPSGSDSSSGGVNRAEPSGSEASDMGVNRAKPPGSETVARRVNRAKPSGQTGQNRPGNQPQEPTSWTAAAQPGQTGRRADGVDGVSDVVDYPARPEVVDGSVRRRALERHWRSLVGSEPVLADPDASALHDLVERGAVTPADVEAGIRDAMGKPGWRIKRWHQLCGWARGALSARLASSPKAEPATVPRDPTAIEFPGGVFRPLAAVEAAVEAWHGGAPWNESLLGDAPDNEFTSVPAHLRGPRRPRAAPDGTRKTEGEHTQAALANIH